MLNLKIFTRGLYSTWCHLSPYNLLFDCGEGCATAIGSALPGIDKIFISHTHGDHINGLPSVIGCRNTVNGTSRNKETMHMNKPLTIYYPEDNYLRMDAVRQFIRAEEEGWLRYLLEFKPIREDFKLELAKNVYLEPVRMLHQKNASTYGYVVYEMRSRLKSEYAGMNIPELLSSGKVRREMLNETYRHNKLAYLFDGYTIVDIDRIFKCDTVLIDATFINQADRTSLTHFTANEAMAILDSAGVKDVYLGHISPRYAYDSISVPGNRISGDTHLLNPTIVNCI